MSKEHVKKIKCPNCGKENNFTIWDSLNGTLDPQGKQQLLDGTLFKYKCSACGHITNIDYPILYHDMDHNVMVQYVHEDEAEDAVISLKKAIASMPVKLNTKLRVVTSQNGLREKAVIFDNGLDDKIIEMMKYIYLEKANEDHPDSDIKEAYFFIDGTDYCVALLGKKSLSVAFTRELYDDIAEMNQDIVDYYSNEAMIDQNWAKRIMPQED